MHFIVRACGSVLNERLIDCDFFSYKVILMQLVMLHSFNDCFNQGRRQKIFQKRPTEKRSKNKKKRKIAFLSLFKEGGGATEKRPKNNKQA